MRAVSRDVCLSKKLNNRKFAKLGASERKFRCADAKEVKKVQGISLSVLTSKYALKLFGRGMHQTGEGN